jgi:starch synthase
MDGLAAWKADIIHAHSHRYGNVLEAGAVSQATGVPLVVSLHYHPADREEPAWKAGLLRVQDHVFGGTVYRDSRALIVESRFEAGLISAFVPRDRIRIVPPGIDLSRWTTTDGPAPAGLPPRYILFTGRVARNKGLPTLVEALALLPSDRRLPLVVMGRDWGERANVDALARRLGVADHLHWLEYVESEEAYRATFAGATLFALPSQYEAFGLVLLEAMAAHVPVVASRVGGVPEVLDGGRCGRLAPFGDAPAWADALQAVLSDRDLAQGYVEAGNGWVQQFDWNRAVDRHLELYRELVGG